MTSVSGTVMSEVASKAVLLASTREKQDEARRSASRGSDAFQFFLLADGIGGDIALAGFGQLVDDAVL